MKYISKEKTEQIIQGSDIVEIISEFVSLTKTGREYKGLCPFHHEKTPSFTVNPTKKVFHCFGCGAGGDLISFLMKYESYSFNQALQFLAHRQGIKIARDSEETLQLSVKEGIITINQITAEYYHRLLLRSPNAQMARTYLTKRNVSNETIKEFYLGYSRNSWRDLLFFLRSKNISPQKAYKAGLISMQKKSGKEITYDKFRGRIIFPIVNEYGQIIAFGGRKIDDKTEGPKYLNSPETPAYNKSKCLYGLYQAKNFIRSRGYAVLVEGYMDFLSFFQRGIKNTVATLGTALNREHLRLLKRYTNKIVFIYDSDIAGISAMARGLSLFQEQQIEANILLLPPGFDPDNYIQQFTVEEVQEKIKESLPATDFLMNYALQKYSISTIDGKVKASEEILRILSDIPSPLVRMEYLKKAANLLDVKEEVLFDQLRAKARKGKNSSEKYQGNMINYPKAQEIAEKVVLSLLLKEEIAIDENFIKILTPENFQFEGLREIARVVLPIFQKGRRVNIEELLFIIKDEKLKEVVSSLLYEDIVHGDAKQVFQDCLNRLIKYRSDKKLVALQNEIWSKQQDDPSIDLLMKEYLEIKKKPVII